MTVSAIFGRLLGSRAMTRTLARHVLTLGFTAADQLRMADLATRNQEGSALPEEQAELQAYVEAGHLLALLQSQARKTLSRR